MTGMPLRAGKSKSMPSRPTKGDTGGDTRRVTRCRVCGGKNLTMVLDLGKTPLANSYLSRPTDPEKWFPLQLLFCNDCTLVQLSCVVNPALMFREYSYRTSTSQTMQHHFDELAESIRSKFLRSSKDLVVEIGSNDGTLLGAFKKLGARVLGIDPAENLAKIANQRGLETLPEFFNSELALKILETKGPAKVVIGSNVFAHVDDLHDLMRGVLALLEDDGIFSIEVPYLGDLVQNVEYDTIYHEHLSYFTVHPIASLFAEFGMQLLDVARLETHGGSIRVTGKKTRRRALAVPLLSFEDRCGLNKASTYRSLAQRVRYQKEYLNHTLKSIKTNGHKIAGYGAPAKGNTMLNFCRIGTDTLDYLVDTTPEKIGKYSPGMHIPIRETRAFHHDPPPFALLLAWNYEKEIILKEQNYTGRFIVPIPSPRVLSRSN
jgi:SAM-dependent methyltransferase